MTHAELIAHQQHLRLRNAQLRTALADQAQVFQQPLAMADRATAMLQWLYRRPQWPLTGLAVLVILRPRRALVWGGRVWWAWQTWQQLADWLVAQGLFLPRRDSLPLTKRPIFSA